MIPKRRKSPRMGTRTETRVRNAGHLQFVRGFQCCAAGKHTCWGNPEAHHVKSFMDGAMGLKPGDDKVIPVCSGLHHQIHNEGEDATAKRYGLDFQKIAAELWRYSPHRAKHEARQKEGR